jgi:hypothetical protein
MSAAEIDGENDATELTNPESRLDLSLEVMRRDAKPISHIEPVRRCAVGSDAGVEMKALAAETPGLLGRWEGRPLSVLPTAEVTRRQPLALSGAAPGTNILSDV